jgi:hypothetical protein
MDEVYKEQEGKLCPWSKSLTEDVFDYLVQEEDDPCNQQFTEFNELELYWNLEHFYDIYDLFSYYKHSFTGCDIDKSIELAKAGIDIDSVEDDSVISITLEEFSNYRNSTIISGSYNDLILLEQD